MACGNTDIFVRVGLQREGYERAAPYWEGLNATADVSTLMFRLALTNRQVNFYFLFIFILC